jgi:putative ABC transport system permease protein
MATPLAIHNLIHGGWRSVLSMVGISIAIILIFMQLGFLGAVTDTAVIFYDKMDFELLACSPDYYMFTEPGRISRDDLQRIASVPGVKGVQPLHVSLAKWNYAEREVQRGILLIGLEDMQTTFNDPALQQQDGYLDNDQSILVDRASRPQFLGDQNTTPFDESHLGLNVELNGVRCRVAEYVQIGTGLAADGAALIRQQLFRRIVPGYSGQDVCLGLVQLEEGTDVHEIQDRIRGLFELAASSDSPSSSVDVLTRQQVGEREAMYWRVGTPVGFIFVTGAIVAFGVGAIIVYIVLSSDIVKQIGEYATLKAMGYRNRYLSTTVLLQAFVMAIISYSAALAVSVILYQVVGSAARLPISMNGARMAVVLVSALLMCFLSAMIAMQKLRQADPADLF